MPQAVSSRNRVILAALVAKILVEKIQVHFWLFNRNNGNTGAAKSLQSCPTLCDTIDGSPPGYPAPGILQARTLEWVAISFSA